MAIKNNVLSGKKWMAPDSVKAEYSDEMYAVGKKFPHHEENTSGDLVLSRSGLASAAADIAKDEGLSDEDRAAAKAHLRRHYEEHNLSVPGSVKGEMCRAFLDGEMLAGDEADKMRALIVVRDNLDSSLKEDDADPVDYIVKVRFRTNKKGWIYDDSAYDAIVRAVYDAKMPIPCFKGHQSQEGAGHEFREHGGTVIGALKSGEYVYYRIIVDADEAKLKRLIRKGLLGEVSIWGLPSLLTKNGEVHVVDYELWSVDFTPPNRTGQDVDVVSVGEMDGSYEDLRNAIQQAVRDKYPDWVWIEKTFDGKAIAETGGKYFEIEYREENGAITLGNTYEVDRVVKYTRKEESKMELHTVPNDALLAELKARTADGRIAPVKAAGEMGIAMEDATVRANAEKYAKVVEAAGEMDPVAAVQYGKDAKAREESAAKEKALGEMVTAAKTEKKLDGEMLKWVDKLGRFSVGMTREQVAGEIDRITADPDVKSAVERSAITKPLSPRGKSNEVPVVEA